MADDLKQTGRQDDQRINLGSKELGVSREELVKNVRQHLNR